jgi:hypothetical protein
MIIFSQLKTYFDRITTREKLLLNIFVWICLLTWLTFGLSRCQAVRKELTQTKNTLKYQQLWLDNEELINSELETNLSRLKPENTFTSSQLVGKIDRFARQSGLKHEISSPKTESKGIFEIHTLNVTAKQASIDKLIAFNDKLKEAFPYIALERVQITANKSNPGLLDGRFTIISFELKNLPNTDKTL